MTRLLSAPILIYFCMLISAAFAGVGGDEALLGDLSRRSFDFFWEQGDPTTGLLPDRARADGTAPSRVASIAGVGFGITAWCIGAERGWVKREEVQARAEAVLRFLKDVVPNERGFLPHFVDRRTGVRAWSSEFSSIDTALLLHGALTARQYFPGTAVAELATELYERVDWDWMSNGRGLLCHGWSPETGFLTHYWSEFSEHIGMTLLAIASPTHPLAANAWKAWRRATNATYAGRGILHYPPLFVHQFPQAWWNLKGWVDGDLDLFENAREATLAQRDFCVSLSSRFPGYAKDMWGITSSDSANGYVDWGGPPINGGAADERIDGTVVPCAAAGSLPFAPAECIETLRSIRERFGERVYGRYGFADAFHPENGWTNPDVIGIDLGITLLMVENYRTGFVWNWFSRNPEVAVAMERAAFRRLPAQTLAGQ